MTTKIGKILKELEGLCRSRDWNFCIAWQRITGYTVEIYTGYIDTYRGIYYGEASSLYKVIKKGVQFIEKQERNDNRTKIPSSSTSY